MKTSNNSIFFEHKIIEELTEEEISITSDDLMQKNEILMKNI